MDRSQYSDVALGKPTFQSSYSKWAPMPDRKGAMLNIGRAPYAFHTGLDEDPWWRVDLLCRYPIAWIVLHNRSDGLAERASGIRVETSEDGATWELVHAGIAHFGSEASDTPLRLPLAGMHTARHVRLSLTGSTYLHLRKVEVWVEHSQRSAAEAFPDPVSPPNDQSNRLRTTAAIVGTSNSINGGYVPAMEATGVAVARNSSFGSSHSTLVPYALHGMDGMSCDFVVVDIVVNELHAERHRLPVGGHTPDILDYLRAWCLSVGCIPIVLVLPVLEAYSDDGPTRDLAERVRQRYVEYCRSGGVVYFDAHPVVEKLAKAWGRPIESLFKDSAHLNVPTARWIGAALAQQLSRVREAWVGAGMEITGVERICSRFSYLPATPVAPETMRVWRRTSLVEQEFVRLPSGEALSIDAPEDSELVGIVLNMAQTTAALRIEGDTALLKRLDNSYYKAVRPLWLVVWSLVATVALKGRRLQVRCTPSTTPEPFEDNDHRQRNNPHLVGAEPVVELAGFVLRHAPAPTRIASVAGFNLDLASAVSVTDVDSLP